MAPNSSKVGEMRSLESDGQVIQRRSSSIDDKTIQQKVETISSDHQQQATTMEEECAKMGEARKLVDFYRGKRLLVTGSTGFIGKVFLAKLITSLGNCGQIYVMLRSKKSLTAQQRLNKILNEEPFLTSRSRNPEADWSKLIALEGDMSSENLGLSRENCELVCNECDIIFNIAASVQFDAPLKQNLRDNYLGVSNLMNLACKFKRLTSLVHVSTFYTNWHKPHITEEIIPMNADCEKLAELINWLPDQLIDQISSKLIRIEQRPNSYIYTKAMAENLVQKFQGRLPIAIVRPSIVTPAVRDPMPGWVDNVNGPMGLGTLASLGILRTIDWNYYGVADMIPVDTVANSMLAVAERTARVNDSKQLLVYNCSSSSLNPMTWGEGFEILKAESLKAPPYKMLRIPIDPPRHRRANSLMFKFTKLSEILFAYFIDFILMLCGQKQILTKLTKKLHHGYEILKPFTTKEYTCSNENLLAAFEELHPDDKQEFNFDVRTINWQSNFADAYYGTRTRLLKEDMSNVPAALFKYKVHLVVETLLRLALYATALWYSYKFFLNLSPRTPSTLAAAATTHHQSQPAFLHP